MNNFISLEHGLCEIKKLFQHTFYCSTYGWDHVVQGLVELGFILMDAFGPKAAFGRIDVTPSLQSGPTHQACQLGAKLLLHTFKVTNDILILC